MSATAWNQWQQSAEGAEADAISAEEDNGGTPQATGAAIALAAELGIDINTVTGTGYNGKVTKPDVEAASA